MDNKPAALGFNALMPCGYSLLLEFNPKAAEITLSEFFKHNLPGDCRTVVKPEGNPKDMLICHFH